VKNNAYFCIVMKRVCIYLIVFLMSALIVYGGAGINVASFCCDDCQSAGIEGIVEGACCEIHHHHHDEMDHPESDRDIVEHSHELCCSLSRIVYDWNTSNPSIMNPAPDGYDLLAIHIQDVLILSSPIIKYKTFESSSGPPDRSPQDYLSLLTTLLI